jgi:hypothetical protein
VHRQKWQVINAEWETGTKTGNETKWESFDAEVTQRQKKLSDIKSMYFAQCCTPGIH